MRKYELSLEDILEAIRKIEKYSAKNIEKDEMAFDAVLRNIEIIGEAVKNIPQEVKDKHKGIEWKKIAGIRDIITHAYFGVDKEIISEIILTKLPLLKKAIISIKK